jgi:hypothetical protein
MMRNVFINAASGATSASAAVLVFFAIRRVTLSVPYVWSWAMLAAIGYGWVALRLSIYGKGGVAPNKWKNGLLGVAIVVGAGAACLITDPLVGAPAENSIAAALAALMSMAVSDALG